jgi:NADH-quinone oxidoreductase subunit L
MTIESIIWLIPLPPLLAFFLIVLFTHRSKALSHAIAIGAALLSWFGSMYVFLEAMRIGGELGEHPFESVIPWLPAGDSWLEIGVRVDPLTAVTLFFVAWTVLMIFMYSVGYHNFGQPRGDHDRKGLPPHGATVRMSTGTSTWSPRSSRCTRASLPSLVCLPSACIPWWSLTTC